MLVRFLELAVTACVPPDEVCALPLSLEVYGVPDSRLVLLLEAVTKGVISHLLLPLDRLVFLYLLGCITANCISRGEVLAA